MIDRSIPFVDTHHHLWDLRTLPYRWLSDASPGSSTPLGDYAMIRSGIGLPGRLFREFYGQNVVKTVHVEANVDEGYAIEETRWLDDVARAYHYPSALVVLADLTVPNAEDILWKHLERSSLVRGVRMREHPVVAESSLLTARFDWLGEHGLSYELNLAPGHLADAYDLAKASDGTQFMLGHGGYPILRTPTAFRNWRRDVRRLRSAPNLASKVSGLGMGDHSWTIDSIRPWILESIETFGVDRVVFGTNWPVDMLWATYFEQVDAYRQVLDDAGFRHEEQRLMLSGNAERLYRI